MHTRLHACLSRLSATDLVGFVVLCCTAAAVAYRITIGVDLSDEAYYATFLDDWLKEGLRASPLVGHQTSELIVYPAAVAFRAITGSSDGLMLYLRALYVAAACGSALVFALFMRRIGAGAATWLGAALVVAFIPFGLPAPSYNTLSEQGSIIGLGACGIALVELGESNGRASLRTWTALGISAIAWTIAIFAYPTMVVPLVAQCCAAWLIVRPPWRVAAAYAGSVVALLMVVHGAAYALFGAAHARDIIAFYGSAADKMGLERKLHVVLSAFTMHLEFAVVSAAAFFCGVFRRSLGALSTALVQCVAIVAIATAEPALFIASHDAVFVIALTGLGLLAGMRSSSLRSRVVALAYGTALAAGLIAAVTTSVNGLFNFAVGGLPAAILAVAAPREGAVGAASRFRLVPAVLLFILIFSVSFRTHYGELPAQAVEPHVRIQTGPFMGISAAASQALLIETARDAFAAITGPRNTVAVIGRTPGLYLLIPALPRALNTYPFPADVRRRAIEATYRYYGVAPNRPAVVLYYTDPYFQAANPFGDHFKDWYTPSSRFDVPPGTLTIFRRRNTP